MVQLRWLWTSTLCLVTMAISGLVAVQSLRLHDFLSVEGPSSTVQRAFYLPMKITNRVFTATLLNSASEEYKTLYKEVSYLLDGIYDCPDNSICPTNNFYGGVVAITFSSGSVIANATVVFNILSINPSIVYVFFLHNANNVEPQTLQLNMNYTTIDKIIETSASPTTTSTTTTTTTTTATPTTTPRTTMTPTTSTTTPTTTTTLPSTTTKTTTIGTLTPTTIGTITPTTTSTTTSPTTIPTTTPITTAITIPTTTTTNTTITSTITAKPASTPATQAFTTTSTATTTTYVTTTITMPAATTTATPATIAITTTLSTITVPTTQALTSTTTIWNSTTYSSKTNTFSGASRVVSTKTNNGNHSDINTTDGRENPTQDSAVRNTTTVNPHDKHTDSHSTPTGNPNDPLTLDGGSSSDGDSGWVPRWGIALLVLAAVILLLLIIILITMLVRWCCKKTKSGHADTTEDPYYTEKKQPPQDSLPVYTPQTPVTQKPGSAPVIIGDTPRKNRTGFYAVNP